MGIARARLISAPRITREFLQGWLSSAGFMFLGNPADGEVDTTTLECFQTP